MPPKNKNPPPSSGQHSLKRKASSDDEADLTLLSPALSMSAKASALGEAPATGEAAVIDEVEVPKFHFALKEEDLHALAARYSLNRFDAVLLSSIVHILNVGLCLNNPARFVALDLSNDPKLKKHLQDATKNDEHTDRFFSLRKTGNSLKYMLQELPTITTRLHILQLLVWRIWGFGNVNHLKHLNFVSSSSGQNDTPELVQAARAAEEAGFAEGDALKAFFDKLLGIFNSFCEQAKLKFLRGVYGNLSLEKKDFGRMLEKLLELTIELLPKDELRSFEHIRNLLGPKTKKPGLVPAMPRHGLLAWVVIADLWEYGLCLGPTAEDLAEQILGMKNSGPFKAFKIIGFLAGQEDVPEITIDGYTQVIKQIMMVFESARVGLVEAGNEIKNLDCLQLLIKDCEEALHRQLGIVDIEHALCKISRERSNVSEAYKMMEAKDQNEGSRPKKKKVKTVRAEEAAPEEAE